MTAAAGQRRRQRKYRGCGREPAQPACSDRRNSPALNPDDRRSRSSGSSSHPRAKNHTARVVSHPHADTRQSEKFAGAIILLFECTHSRGRAYRNDGHQTPPLCRRCAQPLCDGRAPARAVRDTMRRCSQPLRARRRRWPRDCESVCCLNASLRVCSPPRAQTSTRRPRSSASCRCPRSYSRRSWSRMAGARVPPAAPPPRRPASRNSKASVIFSDR